MATACNSGGQSPTSISRNEKVFEDAQYTGVINLSGRKLKDFPRGTHKFDLADTTTAGRQNRPKNFVRCVCVILITVSVIV